MLRQLRSELLPDSAQYGETPKCGAEHMLVDIWEGVLGAMEGGKSAAVLLGVDYEKAFNRMEHSVCLDKLRNLGASEGSISIVRAFLENRSMTITIDGHRGVSVPLLRGSPQGSVLGCLLYCITTQSLTANLRDDRWQVQIRSGPSAFLYVDDTTLLDVVDMDDAIRHVTTEKTVKAFIGLELASDFEVLSRRAGDIGMKINAAKTQLLVIRPPNGCRTVAGFQASDGTLVESVERCLTISSLCLTISGQCLTISGLCLTISGLCLTISGLCLTISGLCLTIYGLCLTISSLCLTISIHKCLTISDLRRSV